LTRDDVVAYIKNVNIGYLATVGADGAPRVRPIGMHTVYDDSLYFFTFSTTRKVAEIDSHPQVEVVWCKLEENSQARIRGKMFVEEDEAIQERFKQDNPMVAQMIPQGAEHLFRLYRLEPEVVEMATGLVPYTVIEW
jgi:uncharacterized pyridoxamine 5'-phosphate oxidase family protein